MRKQCEICGQTIYSNNGVRCRDCVNIKTYEESEAKREQKINTDKKQKKTSQ